MIGREKELKILESAYASSKPELVAILGRRRVGKTFLIRSFFEDRIDFEMVGLKDAAQPQQLRNFVYSMREADPTVDVEKVPMDWLAAFFQLREYLESLGEPNRKKIVFIDELPWVATKRSDFLTGFSFFWNSYVSKKNVMVVICGSATAWMIKKIINNKGGLHNRVTRRIALYPFSLKETEAYFDSRHISFERYQLVQLYMALGGVPHYLDQVEGGKSATQNIDEICFQPQGLLRTEFENLYSSLFSNPARYEKVVTALSSKWRGLSRKEIQQMTELPEGGGLSTVLKELEQSGFITSYIPFQKKKKDTLFRLSDNYSLFYLKFIAPLGATQTQNWNALSALPAFKSWSGYAFENICLQHIAAIKKGLGITGVFTNQCTFRVQGTDDEQGLQIDLLIDRQDATITICEIKFYNEAFSINQKYAKELSHKKNAFKRLSGTKKQVFLAVIASFGVNPNKFSLGLVDNVLDMNDLFQ